MSEWISVKDRLPEVPIDNRGYICRCKFPDNPYAFYMVLSYFAIDKNPHFQHETLGGMRVTHWMPLPDPPKEN